MGRFNPDEELSGICTKLWTSDDNYLQTGTDYAIDLQGSTRVCVEGRADRASRPLFTFVNKSVFERPTFKRFVALLDNYESDTGVAEEVTDEEVQENRDFIDAIMETSVMKVAHEYLVSKGVSPAEIGPFKRQLYDLWFKLYRRTRGNRSFDSSGFEHVFVGETRGKNDVIGFHNWIQFYLQEKRGAVDYKGYIYMGKKKDNDSHLISIQFTWKGSVKPVGSTFLGTSPEFEIALYTLMFLAAPEQKTQIDINGEYDVEVVCHRLGDKLGSSYPVAIFER